jgi:DNA repair protein RecO
VTLLDDDALVLDHHPFRDRHLILAVLTHRYGVHRGVLRRARGGKAPPAAAAQILSRVQVSLYQRPFAELANFRHLDLVTSSYPLSSDLERSAAGAVVAELLLTFSPPAEPAERSFRLGVAALESLLAGAEPALIVSYTEFWVLALGGVFPSFESLVPALSDEEAAFLASCRCDPVAKISDEVPSGIAGWLDRRVREEAHRPLRALEFFRKHTG